MYIQLGNFVFDKAFTPESLNHSDETSYAEHALINLKPRLQPTGNNLEEIEIGIKLRSEIVNVNDTLLALKKSKDEFEVLPFLYGTGIYKGDYVIAKIDNSPTFTLEDGFVVELSLSFTIKEYQVPDKLQQQQNAARKAAFAVGDKAPVRLAPIAKYTPAQITSQDLSVTYSHAAITDQNIRSFQNNVSQQENLSDKIKASITTMGDKLDAAKEDIKKIEDDQDVISGGIDKIQEAKDTITSQIDAVKSTLSNFSFPVTSISDLVNNNTIMQTAISNLKTNSFLLNSLVITRRA